MINFTESQNRTIANALTALATVALVAVVAALGWVLVRFLMLASPALTPVIMGLLLAMFFKPYYAWWRGKVRNPTVAMSLMFLSVLIPFGVAVWYGGVLLVDQAGHLLATAPTIIERASAWVNAQYPELQTKLFNLGVAPEQMYFLTQPQAFAKDLLQSFSGNYSAAAVRASLTLMQYLASLATGLVTMLFTIYFLNKPAVKGADCVNQMPFLKDSTKGFVATQIDSFLDIVISFFQRQTIICLIEGMLYGTGFMLVGLPYGFILGFTLGVLNLIPLFGTVTCLPLALSIAYFGDGGSLGQLIGVLIVWALGQVSDGYLITPKIQGDKTGLGYAGVIFSFFFWGVVFHSLIGLLLAIPLSAFCLVFYRALKQHYIKPIV